MTYYVIEGMGNEMKGFFVGPLIPLFWTSGDVCPGYQSQGGSLACVLSRLRAMDSSDEMKG